MKRIFKTFVVFVLFIVYIMALSSCNTDKCAHEWGEWQMVDELDSICEDGGEQFRICKLNEEHIQYRTVDPQGHSYAGEYGSAVGGHWQTCQVDSCEKINVQAHVSGGEATLESAEYCTVCGWEMSPKINVLTDKKMIIIGNSHFFYSDVVLEKTTYNTSLKNRKNDTGTLYDIAYMNGAINLQITNWTYGNHTFKDLFSGDCQANRECFGQGDKTQGYDHYKDLTDKYYDYVVLQHGPDSADIREEWMEFAMNVFKEANPNVKFILVVPARSHEGTSATKLLPKIKEYEQRYDMTVVDWGGLISDIYNGIVSVPGAKLTHNKDSYVVARTEDDGYHPSLLAGYAASLMTYCAITGESAVGQSWDYYTDSRIQNFITQKYKIRPTNFDEILESDDDMRGLQTLIDQYLKEKPYLEY